MTRTKPFLKTVVVLLPLLFVQPAYGDINSKLLKAAMAGEVAKVERLLEKAVDVNAGAKDGVTSLMVAESNGHTEIVKILTQAGAKK